MLLGLLAVAGGIAVMGRAADELIIGASRLALLFRLSPVVVGAVIIGFGTSAPEMLVSGIAALGGDADVGIGNIVGSNIANLSLILGTSSLLVPVSIHSGVLRREAPLSVAAVVAFGVVLWFGLIPWTGLLLLVALVASLWWILQGNDSEEYAHEVEEVASPSGHSTGAESVRTVLGLVFTVGGAWVLVWGALRVADEFGLSGGFVGLTLVALGTSLPELVTAVAAARAGQTEMIVGNLLGSNLFNALAVGAVVTLLGDGAPIDPFMSTTQNAVMVGVALVAFIAMRTRGVFERFEGIILLVVFAGFLVLSYVPELG